MIKDASDRIQKKSLELTSHEIEQLVKEPYSVLMKLRSGVKHLSDVRKHRKAVARQASAGKKRQNMRDKV